MLCYTEIRLFYAWFFLHPVGEEKFAVFFIIFLDYKAFSLAYKSKIDKD